MLKVVKFGGSSLADAAQIKKASDIILSDPDRRFVVDSAPGKRTPDDDKITDLLYACQKKAAAGQAFADLFLRIRTRFEDIIAGLGISFSLTEEFALIETHLQEGASPDYAASRGEYLNGKILAAYLGFEFVDPADFIRFRDDGSPDLQLTNRLGQKRLANVSHAVIPGFYGLYKKATFEDHAGFYAADSTSSLFKHICTFSRGGSDITGSIVACITDADVYENWTDVSGFLVADPRIVDSPAGIETITYSELRELSYMGATVLHEDSIFPLRGKSIPIHIRNTNYPEAGGTHIVESSAKKSPYIITGVAGKKNFCSINIEKDRMNNEVGFVRRVLSAFEDARIPIEHVPTGIDTMTVFVSQDDFISKEQFIVSEIHRQVDPDLMEIESDLALIAVVGRGIRGTRGQMAATLFTALAEASVNIHMLDQGSSEINIIIGVENRDFERAIRAIYAAFVKGPTNECG